MYYLMVLLQYTEKEAFKDANMLADIASILHLVLGIGILACIYTLYRGFSGEDWGPFFCSVVFCCFILAGMSFMKEGEYAADPRRIPAEGKRYTVKLRYADGQIQVFADRFERFAGAEAHCRNLLRSDYSVVQCITTSHRGGSYLFYRDANGFVQARRGADFIPDAPHRTVPYGEADRPMGYESGPRG